MSEIQRIVIQTIRKDGSIGIPTIPEFEQLNNRIVDPDELVIKERKITILFTYPLSVKVKLEFENKGGFTRLDLFKCIYNGYKKIYDEEEEEVEAQGGKAPGKYGIWGPDWGEFFLEYIFYNPIKRLCTFEVFHY